MEKWPVIRPSATFSRERGEKALRICYSFTL